MHFSFSTLNFLQIILLWLAPSVKSSCSDLVSNDLGLQTQIMSKQQMKQVEAHLAHLLDLPAKRFQQHERQKRMARSESRFLLEMYHKKRGTFQQTSDFWKQHKTTVEKSNYIVTFGIKNGNLNDSRSHMELGFNLSAVGNEGKLISAELRLFRRPSGDYQGYKILTYTFTKNGVLMLNQSYWNVDDHGWMVINVTNLFVNRAGEFVKIYVSGKVDQWDVTMVEDVGISGLTGDAGEQPFLVAYFNVDLNLKLPNTVLPQIKCRNKRNIENLKVPFYREANPERCSLKIFYVDFQMLDKFTSVIVPDRFQANYCSGECTFPLQGKATNHAIVQALYSSVKFSDLAPLCAPEELSAMDVIHLDRDDNMIHKTYEDMIVEKCNCQ